MDLIIYGLQYSYGMKRPLKTYWAKLIVETERAIKPVDTKLTYLLIYSLHGAESFLSS